MAASEVTVEILGISALVEKLRELNLKAKSIEKEALIAAADPIYRDAYARAPVRTGRGRDSITVVGPTQKNGAPSITVGVHKQDLDWGFYMRFQEFGTSKMKPHPDGGFLGPAYENNKAHAYEIIKNKLREGIGL